jgi:hypothetical protein
MYLTTEVQGSRWQLSDGQGQILEIIRHPEGPRKCIQAGCKLGICLAPMKQTLGRGDES